MLGMEKHAAPISLGSFDLLKGRSVCGSLFGGLKSKVDIPILVDSYLKKVYMNLSMSFQYFLFSEVLSKKSTPISLFTSLKFSLFFVFCFCYQMQELNLDSFITHEMNFEEINKAFDLLKEGKSIRCILWMGK